jgi:hypothetical protein
MMILLHLTLFVLGFPEGWWSGFLEGLPYGLPMDYPSGFPEGWGFPLVSKFTCESLMPKERIDARGAGPRLNRHEALIPELMYIGARLGGAYAHLCGKGRYCRPALARNDLVLV